MRDPIHDYVPFSWLEEFVIDSPLFQRLRYVSQNALAHQTYPSNRTARFTHSLGTMHLGGRFFEAIIRNSDREMIDQFSDSLSRLITRLCTQHQLPFDRVFGHLRKDPDAFYRHLGMEFRSARRDADERRKTERTNAERICVLQAIRLACVLHDIGHPVFSHTGEAVLDAQLAFPPPATDARKAFHDALAGAQGSEGGGALHEALGFRLMSHILQGSIPEGDGFVFAQVCLHLARGIVRESMEGVDDPDGLLPALHEIISGDVDADRADYVRRDGYSSAFEFGTYDLGRIVLCLRLVRDDGKFLVRPSSTALSAVESFFIERFRIYRWLVFHHSVMRGQLAIQRGLYILFSIYFGSLSLGGPGEAVRACLTRYLFARFWEPFAEGGSLDAFKTCDESWAMTLFHELLDEPSLASASLPEPLAILRSCLDLITERNKRGLKPMWKRLDQYQEFARAFQVAAREDCTSFFESGQGDDLKADLDPDESAVRFVNTVFAQQFPKELRAQVPFPGGEVALYNLFEEEVAKAWTEAPGRVLFTYKAGMNPGPSKAYKIVDASSGHASLDIDDLSTQVRSLDDVWSEDTQSWAYFLPGRMRNELFEPEEVDVTAAHRRQFARAAARVLLDPTWRPRLNVLVPLGEPAGGMS